MRRSNHEKHYARLADLVVLSEDPAKVDPDSLIKVPVEKTMVGGKFVWDQQS